MVQNEILKSPKLSLWVIKYETQVIPFICLRYHTWRNKCLSVFPNDSANTSGHWEILERSWQRALRIAKRTGNRAWWRINGRNNIRMKKDNILKQFIFTSKSWIAEINCIKFDQKSFGAINYRLELALPAWHSAYQ